jgi:hypothetical protein
MRVRLKGRRSISDYCASTVSYQGIACRASLCPGPLTTTQDWAGQSLSLLPYIGYPWRTLAEVVATDCKLGWVSFDPLQSSQGIGGGYCWTT